MKLRNTASSSGSRRGATAVELALTLPILFLLVFGAIEFSRAQMLQHTTEIATTEAARASIVPGATAADCESKCMSELSVLGITQAVVDVDPPVILDETTQVTVTVRIPVSAVNQMILPTWFYENTMFKSVTMQREGKTDAVGNESPTTGAVFLSPET